MILDMDGVCISDEHERRRHKGNKDWAASKRWLARAYDPAARKYRGRCFDVRSEALDWAKQTRASFVLGQDSASKADLAEVAPLYLEDLKSRSNPQHFKEVSEILNEVIAAKVTDLRDDLFMVKVRRWIERRGALEQNREGKRWIRRRDCLELSERTKNLYVSHVRKAIRFALDNRIIALDPMRGWRNYREDKPLKPVFTIPEIKRLLDPSKSDHPMAIVTWIMLLAGLRLQEACFLAWEDVDDSQIMIRIKDSYRLKFNRERVIDLQPDLKVLLSAHRQTSGWIADLKDSEGVAYRDRPSSYRYWFASYLKACDVTIGNRSPHSCRHTLLSLLLASGADVYSVMQTAGHSSIVTTMGYCKNAPMYKKANVWTKAGELSLLQAKPSAA